MLLAQQESAPLLNIMSGVFLIAILAYLPLQILALVKLRAGWRLLALAPMLLVVVLVIRTMLVMPHDNLAGPMVMMALLAGTVLLVPILLLGWFRRKGTRRTIDL